MRHAHFNWFEKLVRARRVPKPRLPGSSHGYDSSALKPERALTTSDNATSIFGSVAHKGGQLGQLAAKWGSDSEWPIEHCATEPESFVHRFLPITAARLARPGCVALILLFTILSASSAVKEVQCIELTVDDLDREVRFFTQILPFEEVSRSEAKGRATDDLLGLNDARLRVAQLRLGNERMVLTEHMEKGRPIPSDSRSYDHWFQHIAIVVSDMDKAYAHLRKNQVKHVSAGPQTLPEWNPNAGGIRAFYFQDPEDHVLEIIWFPPGKGDPKWQRATTRLFQGIDHTAIVVSDTERSLAFYRDLLGMKVAGESENYGVEQEHLNQVFGARLRITGLRSDQGPGIEFLEYLTPSGGRPLPQDSKANDITFWRTDLKLDHLDEFAGKLRETGVRLVSKGVVTISGGSLEPVKTLIVRDPDGHALQLIEPNPTATASTR